MENKKDIKYFSTLDDWLSSVFQDNENIDYQFIDRPILDLTPWEYTDCLFFSKVNGLTINVEKYKSI